MQGRTLRSGKPAATAADHNKVVVRHSNVLDARQKKRAHFTRISSLRSASPTCAPTLESRPRGNRVFFVLDLPLFRAPALRCPVAEE